MDKLDTTAGDYQKQARRLKEVMKNTFNSPQGKEVLKALREEFYDCQIHPGEDLQFKAGQRDVLYQILTGIDEI